MRIKDFSAGIILLTLISLTGCNAGSENANANRNENRATANANTPATATANTNANSNANDNRGLIPTREEYERNKEKYAKEAKDAGRKIGSGVGDGWLWVKARYELAAADDLRDSTIDVDVDHDAVTLTGTVPTAVQNAKLARPSRLSRGRKAVKNQIVVAPAKLARAQRRLSRLEQFSNPGREPGDRSIPTYSTTAVPTSLNPPCGSWGIVQLLPTERVHPDLSESPLRQLGDRSSPAYKPAFPNLNSDLELASEKQRPELNNPPAAAGGIRKSRVFVLL